MSSLSTMVRQRENVLEAIFEINKNLRRLERKYDSLRSFRNEVASTEMEARMIQHAFSDAVESTAPAMENCRTARQYHDGMGEYIRSASSRERRALRAVELAVDLEMQITMQALRDTENQMGNMRTELAALDRDITAQQERERRGE